MGKMIKYVIEKGYTMPLCAKINDNYVNYLSGEVITNKNIINFIKKYIKSKKVIVSELDIKIYKIDNKYNYYCFSLNGCNTYLDKSFQPVDEITRKYINNQLLHGTYIPKLIWGEKNE